MDDTHLFEGKNWVDLKARSIIVPPSSWAKIKSYFQKKCEEGEDCGSDDAVAGQEAADKLEAKRKK